MRLFFLMVLLALPIVEATSDVVITTDQLIYQDGDLITVTVTPSDELFNLEYANQSYSIKDTLQIPAVYPYNRLVIVTNGHTYDHVIHVTNEDVLPLLLPIFLFGSANYLFTHYLRIYLGGL